jgi:hypothetical protein
MFKSRLFKPKRRCGQSHITRVLEKLPELLNVNEDGYDVYTETGDGDVVIYRVEFKKPVKVSDDGYNELLYFLWKTNKDVKFAIIEDGKDTTVCDNCYDMKIYIDREVSDGSMYIKSIRFEEKL